MFDIRNMELKMSQHIRKTCLWSVTLKVEDALCTDLDAYTRKQKIPCTCKLLPYWLRK